LFLKRRVFNIFGVRSLFNFYYCILERLILYSHITFKKIHCGSELFNSSFLCHLITVSNLSFQRLKMWESYFPTFSCSSSGHMTILANERRWGVPSITVSAPKDTLPLSLLLHSFFGFGSNSHRNTILGAVIITLLPWEDVTGDKKVKLMRTEEQR
jgi:hypothetical protein